MPTHPIPKGYHSITPLLTVKDVSRAIDFYQRAFGATENYSLPGPDGKTVMHAELKIGDSIIMLGTEMDSPDGSMKQRSAETLHASPVGFCIYVPEADRQFKTAVEAGAKEIEGLKDQFWGDRMGTVADPFGYHWSIATRREELTLAEINERAKKFFASRKAA